MSVDLLFPETLAIRDPLAVFPDAWQRLLVSERIMALEEISDCIGLPEDSLARRAILRSDDLAVTVPREEEDKADPNLWTLVVEIRHDVAMLFYFPDPELSLEHYDFPIEYLRICKDLGLCQFSQYSGVFEKPGSIFEFGKKELLPRTTEAWVRKLEPFCAQGTGDYFCWINEDYSAVWYWDHETGKVGLEKGVDGFVSWFEKEALSSWKCR
jgi:hypothetical protein